MRFLSLLLCSLFIVCALSFDYSQFKDDFEVYLLKSPAHKQQMLIEHMCTSRISRYMDFSCLPEMFRELDRSTEREIIRYNTTLPASEKLPPLVEFYQAKQEYILANLEAEILDTRRKYEAGFTEDSI